MTTPPEGRCQSCQQIRPLFTFSWVPVGWYEFIEAQLCVRCHSAATVDDEHDGLAYDVFGVAAVMAPLTCDRCGDENGPFIRESGKPLCEDCADELDGVQ